MAGFFAASPKVTGAVGLYCGVGPNNAAAGLGYGREAPRIQRKEGWVPFFTDLGGPVISFDELFAGEEALVSITLNYYRSDTLRFVEDVTRTGSPMVMPWGSIGAFAVQEGLAYPIAMVFPFAAKAAYKEVGLPPGVRFYAAKVESFAYSQGTLPVEINIIWKCKAVFNKANGAFALGDNNVAGLAPIIV